MTTGELTSIISIGSWLADATKKLVAADISTARLDCLILLEDCLNIDRAQVLAHLDRNLNTEQIKWLSVCVAQRAEHKPLAYIRKKCDFYGRPFFVDERVLVPRVETEPVIDFLKAIAVDQHTMRIADIGSGSGCIGITATLEIPGLQVDLYDIDASTFDVARHNATHYHVQISCHVGDLLRDLVTDYDVVIANLPYVPEGNPENVDVYFEPSHALFAGNDGLNLYRDFWQQLGDLSQKPAYILTECRPKQQQPVLVTLAANSGYALTATNNFIQKFELAS